MTQKFIKGIESTFCKSLLFLLPKECLDYEDYMVPFELLFGDTKSVDVSTFQNDSRKPKHLHTFSFVQKKKTSKLLK